MCARARACKRANALCDELRTYVYTYTRDQVGTRRASIALTFWTYLTTLRHRSPSPLPSMWPMQARPRRRGVHAPKIISSRSPSAVERHTRSPARPTPEGLGAFAFAPSSGWAARRRTRTRPVRVIARHTLAHNGTATTPFARESTFAHNRPAIRYTTAARPADCGDGADHARHYAQLMEECGRERRPIATRASPLTTRSPTRLFSNCPQRGTKAPRCALGV